MDMTLRSHASAGVVVTILLAGTSASFAATLSVCPSGCQFSSIQSAVNAAVAGDTLAIGKGHYLETISIVGKRLTLQGADRRTTIIDGDGKGTVVTIGDPDGEVRTPVSISDVTITRGFAHGATDPKHGGGGINVAVGASLTLRHSIVSSNHSDSSGGGINAILADSLLIHDVVFSNNDAHFEGGGVWATGENDTVDIANATFVNNSAGSEGGGLGLSFSRSPLSFSAVSFLNNTAARGGGASLSTAFADQPINVNGLVATNNSSIQDGGGLLLAGQANLQHAIIAQNTAGTEGGGIVAFPGELHPSTVTLTNSYVVQNSAASGGGISLNGSLSGNSSAVLVNTVLANNQPDNCTGGGGCH
jgi:hypothetical protein